MYLSFLISLFYPIFLASWWFTRRESEDERQCSLMIYLTTICRQWEFLYVFSYEEKLRKH